MEMDQERLSISLFSYLPIHTDTAHFISTLSKCRLLTVKPSTSWLVSAGFPLASGPTWPPASSSTATSPSGLPPWL